MAVTIVALAQAAPEAATAGDEIVVTAPFEPFAIPAAKLRRAQAAFAKDRARLAPEGVLLFELRPKGETPAAAEPLAVWLADGATRVPVAIDPLGRFRLPAIPAGDWTLRANRRGSALGLRALVLTPGFEGERRWIGDLRLHCRVNWAVQSDRYSFIQRSGFAMVGGCDSRRIAFFFGEARLLAGASLRGRALPLGKGDRSFYAPIGDRQVGDGELVSLTFR